jgi:hypothetical protein
MSQFTGRRQRQRQQVTSDNAFARSSPEAKKPAAKQLYVPPQQKQKRIRELEAELKALKDGIYALKVSEQKPKHHLLPSRIPRTDPQPAITFNDESKILEWRHRDENGNSIPFQKLNKQQKNTKKGKKVSCRGPAVSSLNNGDWYSNGGQEHS